MTDLVRALRELADLFERLGTPYVVMGGIAVRVYGIPRATYDLDFTVSLSRGQLPDFFEAVTKLGYTVPEEYRGGWVDKVADMPLVKVRHFLEGRGVDVDMFLAESAFQQQVVARRRREQIDHLTVWMISPEDLILLKLLAGRPRDLADIGDVFFTQGELDTDYLRNWAQPLGVLPALEKVFAESGQ